MNVRDAIRAAVLGAAAGSLLVACSVPGAPAPGPTPTPGPPPAPEPPQAACLLDAAALGTATGVAWTVDETTASDLRCVYDPAGSADDVFVVVDVLEDGADADTVAQVCTDGTRAPVDDGFGCRLATGGVFAARADGDRLVTAAAAQVPTGTTAEQLGSALAEQLG